MTQIDIVSGDLLDDMALTLDEFARACGVEPQWVIARVEAELISSSEDEEAGWRFTSADLLRARRLAAAERMFETNPDAAAFVVDLIEEVHRLRGLLARSGH